MDVSTISNNSLDIQSLLINSSKSTNVAKNSNDTQNQSAYYAKKGEPMYMEDMDSDKDGVVTLDEFRDYCKSKGMNTQSMMKMSQLASAYRTMKAENEAIDNISKLIPNITPKVKQADSHSSQVKQSDSKFNISEDSSNSKMVSYEEYIEYCERNVLQDGIESNTKYEETEDGKFKLTNTGKSINLYKKSNEHKPLSTFEEEA